MRRDTQHRRGFVTSTAVGLLGLVAGRRLLGQQARPTAPDDRWLKGLTGRHRQFFDVGSAQNGVPLRRVHQFLATYTSAYGLRESEVNAVFGAHDRAIGIVLGDQAWARYEVGTLHGIQDPETGKPAVRNPFIDIKPDRPVPPDGSILRLQARGVVFLACGNTLTNLSQQLANAGKGQAGAILRDLRQSVLPGVSIVPAMLVAGNLAQEAGLTYAALG